MAEDSTVGSMPSCVRLQVRGVLSSRSEAISEFAGVALPERSYEKHRAVVRGSAIGLIHTKRVQEASRREVPGEPAAVVRSDAGLREEAAEDVLENGAALRVRGARVEHPEEVLVGRDDGVVDELVDGIKDVEVVFVEADGAGLGVPLAHGAETTSTSTDAVT